MKIRNNNKILFSKKEKKLLLMLLQLFHHEINKLNKLISNKNKNETAAEIPAWFSR